MERGRKMLRCYEKLATLMAGLKFYLVTSRMIGSTSTCNYFHEEDTRFFLPLQGCICKIWHTSCQIICYTSTRLKLCTWSRGCLLKSKIRFNSPNYEKTVISSLIFSQSLRLPRFICYASEKKFTAEMRVFILIIFEYLWNYRKKERWNEEKEIDFFYWKLDVQKVEQDPW